MIKRKKAGADSDTVFWVVTIALTLVVLAGGIYLMRGKLGGMGEFIKNLFSFGR